MMAYLSRLNNDHFGELFPDEAETDDLGIERMLLSLLSQSANIASTVLSSLEMFFFHVVGPANVFAKFNF